MVEEYVFMICLCLLCLVSSGHMLVLTRCFSGRFGDSAVFADWAAMHRYPNVRFYLYDVEECEDIAQELGVSQMPTFSIFKDGDIQDGVTGAKPKEIRKAIEDCL
jgi:hypothetical protein